MKVLIMLAISLFIASPAIYAELTNDEKYFMVGKALTHAYILDSASDICNGSINSREKFNTLKNLVQEKFGLDLYKSESGINKQFGKNVRDNLKIVLPEYISDLGGCGSKNYYEWLVKTQKDYGESLVVIANME